MKIPTDPDLLIAQLTDLEHRAYSMERQAKHLAESAVSLQQDVNKIRARILAEDQVAKDTGMVVS